MTTTTAGPLHMIRFHDPFRVSKRTLSPLSTTEKYNSTSTGSMSEVRLAYRPEYHQQEHTHQQNSELMPEYRSHAAPHYQAQVEARQHSLQSSPIRERTNSVIATNFQIPRAVNNSGGSLAELAAQITCLFWFESADVLRDVAESSHPHLQALPLSSDVKPTIGFRKWVTTILSTTCVAQNVVLLALLFIYRLKKQNPTVRGKPGSEYRLLTVALMLGNKFLDDNTYTNKTWAEVSGINVGEVHIMEVEFLSNMKYCLFTSEQDWSEWQTLLGKFAAFFETATKPLYGYGTGQAPTLPPTSSLHVPGALPSPPSSTQASPPYNGHSAHPSAIYGNFPQHGPTPVPSPLNNYNDANNGPVQPRTRKRSHEESSIEPPSKRIANGHQESVSPHRYSNLPAQAVTGPTILRLTLPGLPVPQISSYSQPMPGHQLPPFSVPARAMAMAYPSGGAQGLPQITSSAGPSPQSQASQHQARVSPSSSLPQSAVALHPPTQISPSYVLQQRNSPYRPVHNVSTLLYPPPSGAMQSRIHNVELNQMHYQPLGKPVQHAGRLPYVAQNLWLDGNQPQEMTPIHRWPGFPKGAPQQQY